MPRKSSSSSPRPLIVGFRDVLSAAGPRPKPGSGSGPGYATAFANAMATFLANAFRDRFPGIKPDPSGKGVESPSRALRGLKKLDVNFSTPQAGLCLGISLKSVHLPDKNPQHRYHHNRKRNDEELRVEAAGYHQRQPYSVLAAVVVLPFEACDDADSRPSSFGMWVQYLWPLARRNDPHDDVDRMNSEAEMARYFVVEPEVAGELGADTVMDTSIHPPRVLELHYEFKGWLGDDLLESFPCYIVTDRCKAALEKGGFSGHIFGPARVTASDTFLELYPGRALPGFHWLRVNGTAGKDDFGLSRDHRLTVSDRVLKVLELLSIEHCDIEDFIG